MRYRNMKTGVVVDVPSELRGAWLPVISVKKAEKPSPAEAPAEKVEEETKTPARKRTYTRKKK